MKLVRTAGRQNIITKPCFLVDWRSRHNRISVTIAPNQSVHYFLIEGLSGARERIVDIRLERGSSLCFTGVVISGTKDVVTIRVNTVHEHAKTRSSIILKGVALGQSHLTLECKVIIPRQARASRTRLEERAFVLSSAARATVIPNLAVHTDDATASHAAAVCHANLEELFYLATRGLTRKCSLELIVTSFLTTPLTLLPDQQLSARLERDLKETLARCLR